ncbi:uncharacterized protein B0T23DRAFT_421703 [Neurospora hispaniola]|uniref:Uncharacterized protein n=1 Tax=Neurospora hispaniola TaxID=588809 RepID=A0AAJ0I3P9_9PEZI|nr:hypothetical protein B0T23DRAFT_421703 [Neurospora hispaniola]
MSYPLVSEGQPLMVVQDSCDKDGRGPFERQPAGGSGTLRDSQGSGEGTMGQGSNYRMDTTWSDWMSRPLENQLICSSSSSPKHLQLAGLKKMKPFKALICERNSEPRKVLQDGTRETRSRPYVAALP